MMLIELFAPKGALRAEQRRQIGQRLVTEFLTEEAGRRVLPEQVRVLVSERVQAWNGEDMGTSRRWVQEAVVEVRAKHQAAARLALLTALASYQVDSSVVEDFRSHEPDDAQLIAATAWASLTAARRVGVWVAEPFAMAVE